MTFDWLLYKFIFKLYFLFVILLFLCLSPSCGELSLVEIANELTEMNGYV